MSTGPLVSEAFSLEVTAKLAAFSRWIDGEAIEVEMLLVVDAKGALVKVAFVEAGNVELLFTEDGDAKDLLVETTFAEAGDVGACGK